MYKYKNLNDFLTNSEQSIVQMTFRGIESILGARLPPSAYKRREWWANNASGHSHALAWLKAGYRTAEVDMQNYRLVFRRADPPSRLGDLRAGRPARAGGERRGGPKRHPAFGALKGVARLDPGCDPASPAMPEWATLVEDDRLDGN